MRNLKKKRTKRRLTFLLNYGVIVIEMLLGNDVWKKCGNAMR